jgi:4-hydroxy-2-oxoheptanedioate aldolase
LKERLRAGPPITCALITMPSVAAMQIWARSGVDLLIIDMEHGHIDIESVHAMVAATGGTPAVPVVRVPWNVPWLVKPALDSGAAGIVFPMIADAADAAAAVRAMHYPPEGERGWGPFYAPFRWDRSIPDYMAAAGDDILTILLIERPEAIDNIDAIVQVPGIDLAIIATFDLSSTMGYANQPAHPEVAAAVARAEAHILAAGIPLGGAAVTPERARELFARGYRCAVVGFDWMVLQRAIAGIVDGIRAG